MMRTATSLTGFKRAALGAAFAVFALFMFAPSQAHAACTNPAGVEGQAIYNTTHKVMQFCNDTLWISMAAKADTLASLSCANNEVAKWNGSAWACGTAGGVPAGAVAGALQFRGATAVFTADDVNLVWDNTNKRLGIGTVASGFRNDGDDSATVADDSVVIASGSNHNLGILSTSATANINFHIVNAAGNRVRVGVMGMVNATNTTGSETGELRFGTKDTADAAALIRMIISANGAISIGTTPAAPNANAAVDIQSTSKALLLPRVPTATLTGMTTPAAGLLAYDSTSNTLKLRTNSAWVDVGSATASAGTNTIIANWPDAIRCVLTTPSATSVIFSNPIVDTAGGGVTYVFNQGAARFQLAFTSAGVWSSSDFFSGSWTSFASNCNSQSIAQNYTAGRAYNFIGNGSNTAAGSTSEVQFRSGGNLAAETTFVWDNAAKKLGVGQAAPKAFLDIMGLGSGAAPAVTGTTDPTMNLRVSRGTVGVDTGMLDNGTGYTQVRNIADLSVNFNLALQPNGGAVGIGTTTVPTGSKLSVYGGYVQTGIASGATADVAYNWMTSGGDQYLVGNAGGKGWTMVARTDGWSAPANQNDMGLYYWNGVGWTTGFIIDSITGNIGIGATPAQAVTDPKLQVAGAIVSNVNNAAAATTINFATSNVAYTTAACGAFTLQNMADGGSYTLIVKGNGTGPATFTHATLTPKSTGTLTCGSNKHTVFSFIRAGTDFYVTMITGY